MLDQRLNKISLRRLTIAVLSLILLITLVITNVGIYLFVFAAEQNAWQGRQTEAAVSAQINISTFLESSRKALHIADIVEKAEVGGEKLTEILGGLYLAYDAFDELLLTDSAGQVDASLSEAVYRDSPVLNNLFTIPQSNWFVQARSGHTYLSDLQFSPENKPYLILSIPLEDGGVAVGRLRMSGVGDILARNRYGETGSAYLVNSDGQLLAHSDFNRVLENINLNGRPEFTSALQETDGTWSGSYSDFTGSSVVGTSTRVPDTNWFIFTEISQAEAFATSRTALVLLSLVTLVFLSMVIFLGSRFMQTMIFRPLRQLRLGAERVKEGDLEYQIASARDDEFGQVIQAFNAMNQQILERERILAATNEELSRLVDELNVANDKASESARLKAEFLSTISHELRTPMNAIQGFSSIMLNGMGVTLEPKAQGMMERIQANSERMLALINSILDMARIEAGRMQLKSVPFSPVQLARTWEAQTSGLAEQKKLVFRTEVDPQLPPEILGDEEALSKIAINLLGNAFKFTEQGEVGLALKRRDPHWLIEISDTGIGIPEQAREYIFEEFRQADGGTARQYEGTGLGLAIVKKLTQAMGGRVSLESEVGRGTTFRVELPLKTVNEETPISIEVKP